MNPLLSFLIGSWFVTYSNFPMWTNGGKTNPTFTYTAFEKKKDVWVLKDKVCYIKNGKTHSINGFDYPDSRDSSSFIWKGKGILGLLKSQWKIVLKDEQGQWALIYFSKTLFTPEGVDVISRRGQISGTTLEQIKVFMNKDEVLKKFTDQLKQINA